MIVSIIRFRVKKLKGFLVGKIWPAQKNMLKDTPGFVSARLLRSSEDKRLFIIETRWDSIDSLESWKKNAGEKGGEHMERMLRGESKMVEPPYTVERYKILAESD